MSKSVLVIDTPKSCRECNLKFTDEYSDYCPYKKADVYDYVQNNTKPENCPLSPLPSSISLKQYVDNTELNMESMLAYQYAQGWNEFRNEILKGGENV